MNENSPAPADSDVGGRRTHRWGAPAGVITVVAVGLLALPGLGVRYLLHGDLDVFQGLLTLFFSISLVICYWEMCLFFRRDYIEGACGILAQAAGRHRQDPRRGVPHDQRAAQPDPLSDGLGGRLGDLLDV